MRRGASLAPLTRLVSSNELNADEPSLLVEVTDQAFTTRRRELQHRAPPIWCIHEAEVAHVGRHIETFTAGTFQDGDAADIGDSQREKNGPVYTT